MTEQLALSFERLVGAGVCAFGMTGEDWDGPHHCAQCAAEVERGCREFAEAVARGEYDAAGYTPAERKAQQRRRAA
jgi:uncharacterized CHY-type Zn-finger protein